MPELGNCNDKEIHAPWLIPSLRQQSLSLILGQDYPLPIVDHALQRVQALDIYKKTTISIE